MQLKLLPMPKKINITEGFYAITPDCPIVMHHCVDPKVLLDAQSLQTEIENRQGMRLAIQKRLAKPNTPCIWLEQASTGLPAQGYRLEITGEGVCITAADRIGILYGIQTLRQLVRIGGARLPKLYCEDFPDFPLRGFYHDITRGRVPKLQTLMEMADRAVFYKLNHLQFYIEHTFAYTGHSEIWTDKDPLDAEDILILDDYCQKRGIELVPSISPFGHLYETLRSRSFAHLCEMGDDISPYSWPGRMHHHTVNVTDEASFAMVSQMIDDVLPLFSSGKFNICSDETFDLGKGKSKETGGDVGIGNLYVGFLNKLISHVKARAKQVMFWGDIILHHPENLAQIPPDVMCLNWEYGENINEHHVALMAQSGLAQIVCPGVSGWNNLINNMHTAEKNIAGLIRVGKKHGAMGVLNTDWGDYGHVNPPENSVPGMILGAALSWNTDDNRSFSDLSEHTSRVEYGDASGQVVQQLRDLSVYHHPGWYHYVQWFERESAGIRHADDENVKKALSDVPAHKLMDAAAQAKITQATLLELMGAVYPEKRGAMLTHVLSAQGMRLLNLFFLALKRYSLSQEVALPLAPKELAAQMDKWLYDYQQNWRKTCRESELVRIVDAIKWSSGWLRSANKSHRQ